MSIILPTGLPAGRSLRAEGVAAVGAGTKYYAVVRPLRIALLNLMPDKATTETQIARLLGGARRLVELTLCVPTSYRSKTAAPEYLAAYYRPWREVRDDDFDGLIVTGAPIETLAFEDVTYWSEMTEVFDWARTRVSRSLHLCWAAQAALYHYHGVPKHRLGEKMFGVFHHRVHDPNHPVLHGFGPEFVVPVSRHTEVRAADLPADGGLEVLASSPESGLCLIDDRWNRAVCMFNHLEYDADTLKREYDRDVGQGAPVPVPKHYFPDDDVTRPPRNSWQAWGQRFYKNWLDEVYRETFAGPRGPAHVAGVAAAPALAPTGPA